MWHWLRLSHNNVEYTVFFLVIISAQLCFRVVSVHHKHKTALDKWKLDCSHLAGYSLGFSVAWTNSALAFLGSWCSQTLCQNKFLFHTDWHACCMRMGMPLEVGYMIVVGSQHKHTGTWCLTIYTVSSLNSLHFVEVRVFCMCMLVHKLLFNLSGWLGGWFWIMVLVILTWRKEWRMPMFLLAMCLWNMRKRK